MTKEEMIERYGIEHYEQHKLRVMKRQKTRYRDDTQFRQTQKMRTNIYNKARIKELYHNDPTFRESKKVYCKARYVEDGRIDLIENYEFALADDFKDWDIHHRLEIHDDYINSVEHLKLMNLYYNRPPTELIWLKKSEHIGMHRKGKARAQ